MEGYDKSIDAVREAFRLIIMSYGKNPLPTTGETIRTDRSCGACEHYAPTGWVGRCRLSNWSVTAVESCDRFSPIEREDPDDGRP